MQVHYRSADCQQRIVSRICPWCIHSIIQETANQLDVPQNVPICAFDIYSRCFTLMHIRGKRSEVIV